MIEARNAEIVDLMARFGELLQASTERRGWGPEEAEDLIQDSLLLLLGRWDEVRDPASWLWAVARRRSSMGFRSQRQRRETSLEEAGVTLRVPSFEAASNARMDCARRLRRLRRASRVALERRYLFGDRIEEAAKAAAIAASSFGKLRSKAFVRMRTMK